MKDTPSQELVPVSREQMALGRPDDGMSSGAFVQMIRTAVSSGITADNAVALEKMVGVAEHLRAVEAEREYAQALYTLQQECNRIPALKDVDGKYKYAPYTDIWKAVEGPIARNKFTLQWGQRNQNGVITKILTLQHLGGHKRDFEWSIRVGTNAPGTPAGAQAPVLDEQADSRAKRRLLLDVLNITVDSTMDAADLGNGETISAEKSEELFKRWMAVSQNQKAFLDIAGVDTWDKIRTRDLPVLERVIAARERKAQA